MAFSAALEEAGLLPPDGVALVQVGERTGALASVIEQISNELSRRQAAEASLLTALLYPAALLAIAVMAVAIITQVVAPNLAQLFLDSGKEPPSHVALLFAFATFVRIAFPLGVIAILAMGLWFALARASERTRLERDAFALRIPFVGSVLRSQDCARFAAAGSLMIGCGMVPSAALPLAAAAVRNRTLRVSLERALASAAQGVPLPEALASANALPVDLLALMAAGLGAGRLGEVLHHGGLIHAERVRIRVERFVALLTPSATVFAGLIVGGLAYLVVTAVLSLNEVALQ
jgi:type II secretory pathway component PulF